MATCPSSPQQYAYPVTNRCVTTCPQPYFGQASDSKCVLICQYGFYANKTISKCVVCPSTCTTCQGELLCTTCITDYWLYNGTCVPVCPTVSGVYYYADPVSRSCTVNCQAGYFGYNATHFCLQTCPSTFYASTITGRCESCRNGCNTCTDQFSCRDCLDGFILSGTTCIKFCSPSQRYYYGSGCVSSCPDGTYLMSDMITCQACASVCQTCSGTASNCVLCNGGFKFGITCVSACPEGYYPDATLVCQVCTATVPQCVTEPLKFALSTFTENYQVYGMLCFNRPTGLSPTAIQEGIEITLDGVDSSTYTWTASVLNTTCYRITFKFTTALN
jgi:proprotein convertase subtilisin/kexin type 5